MTKFAVFLRAVNVGGNNKVAMATLRSLATDLGYTAVATYLQSGNLVAEAPTTKAADVERAVHEALHAELGLAIDVMARSRKDLGVVIAGNPFEDIADDPKKLHVSFLAGQPIAKARGAWDVEEFAPERFAFGDRCIYLWFPAGAGRSKLASVPWAKRLGFPGTARNWRTVTMMETMLDAGPR